MYGERGPMCCPPTMTLVSRFLALVLHVEPTVQTMWICENINTARPPPLEPHWLGTAVVLLKIYKGAVRKSKAHVSYLV
jgi:hypothetical protein